jgi:hypothetical protein
MKFMSELTPAKDGQIPAHADAVGPGWVPLLSRLHDELATLASDYQVEEIGAAFGRLRLHVAERFDADGEFDGEFADVSGALIDAAVLESQTTCEACGAEGRARLRGDERGTFIRTMCDECGSSIRMQRVLPQRVSSFGSPDGAPAPIRDATGR